jgi:hypothetical protein
MWTSVLRTFSLSALGLALVGCAAAFDGRVYRGDGYTFEVPSPPPSWDRVGVSHAALAFHDKASEGIVAVSGRCDRDGDDVPLRSLTQHLFIQFTDRDIVREDVVPFDGREALRTEATAKLDGVERHFAVWVMKKDRCVYDLMFLSSPTGFSIGVAAFDAWVKGFAVHPRGEVR